MPIRFILMRFLRRFPALAALIAACLWAQDPPKDKKKDPDQIGNRDVDKGINFYSIQREIALGKQLAQQVQQTAKIIDDPIISEYVNRLAQNLARNSDAKVPLTTQVIQDESINALSLPGGFFFVNTGLILAASTEAELAGGMAHEIAHIAARHGTRQASRAQVAQMATIPLIFMGGWAGYGARQAAGPLTAVTLLQFGQAFENEADLLGLQYLYKTGYDPNGMVDMFEKIEALNRRQPGKVSKLFATHPPTGDRIIKVQKNIEDLLKSQPQYVVTTSEFDMVKARLMMLENRHKGDAPDPNRPRLRKAPDKLGELAKSTPVPSRPTN
jgi:predicted Zn-dependent protease